MFIKYKDPSQEENDKSKFKFKPGDMLECDGKIVVVEQYSQSPFDLKPDINCYILRHTYWLEMPEVFKKYKSQGMLGDKYYYRAPREAVEQEYTGYRRI